MSRDLLPHMRSQETSETKAPWRMRESRCTPRNDFKVEQYARASSKLVFPIAFGPLTTVSPSGEGCNSTSLKLRKSRRCSRVTLVSWKGLVSSPSGK